MKRGIVLGGPDPIRGALYKRAQKPKKEEVRES